MMYDNEKSLYRRVIRTLRRIPADIRQELATREFDMGSGHSCLIGTAVRAGLGRAQNLATEQVVEPLFVPSEAAKIFGGDWRAWQEIFSGVLDDEKFPVIERAFTNALLETIPA